MSDNETTTIDELIDKIKDTDATVEERKTALRLLCQLRSESSAPVNGISTDDLSSVVATMTMWGQIGLKNLSLADALEVLREAKARREFKEKHHNSTNRPV